MYEPKTKLSPLDPSVIRRLKDVSSGSLTTELFKKGLRQCFLVGLVPMNKDAVRFAGEAFTMRMIPAREDLDTIETLHAVSERGQSAVGSGREHPARPCPGDRQP